MARASHTSTSTGPQDLLQPAIYWSTQCVEGLLRAQKLQLEMLEAQSAIVRRAQAQTTALASEFWDQWIVHWGGGVPIDG